MARWGGLDGSVVSAASSSQCPAGYNVIVGTSLADTLNGTPGADCILGGKGNDVIRGKGGDDVLIGGQGDDRLYGDAGDDELYGEDGDDRLYGGDGCDIIQDTVGANDVYGQAGNDIIDAHVCTVRGGDGDDRIRVTEELYCNSLFIRTGDSGYDYCDVGSCEASPRPTCIKSTQCSSGESCTARQCIATNFCSVTTCIPTGSDNDCDGVDQDCDGSVDEGYSGTTSCGSGACYNTAPKTCIGGVVSGSCNPLPPSGIDNTCDGVDDDCDGDTDEAYLPTPTTCESGGIFGAGELQCVSGALLDTCTPGAGFLETTCNGGDDDDDGNIDEDVSDGNPCTTDSCSGEFPVFTPLYGTVNCPSDPATVAPATTGPRFYDSVSFLLDPTGTQRGFTPGAVDPDRVTHLVGRVFSLHGGVRVPLGGVRISVPRQPGVGHTFSRADGTYNFLINGGGTETVRFEMDGKLPVERTFRTTPFDTEAVPDVVMIALDSRGTSVAFGGGDYVVHRSSTETDADGSRQVTVLVPPGTSAELVMPDGTRSPMASGTLRTTEYTVGDNGPDAMPGTMPTHIAYTYAAEIGFDEAIAAGAESVEFNQPVPVYVDNFLDFPVGIGVPVGSYSSAEARWGAEPDGIVLEVVGYDSSGRVLLDADGDGAADDVSTLLGSGISDSEREEMTGVFTVGQTFWRFTITHATPYDCNWPFGFADGVEPPTVLSDAEDEDCPGEVSGTVISCDNRTVAEEYPVVGTPHVLRYQSNQAEDYRGKNLLRVQIDDQHTSPPATRNGISAEVTVAGRVFRLGGSELTVHNVGAATYMELEWDGLDFAGRPLDGVVVAETRVCHHYDLVFEGTPPVAASFGRRGGETLSVSIERAAATGDLCISRSDRLGRLHAADRAGLGGLTLSAQHHLDADARIIHFGTGNTRRIPARSFGPAVAVPGPVAVLDVLADGRVVYATSTKVYIRELDATYTLLAGGGDPNYSQGVPGLNTRFANIRGLAVAPDGSILVSEDKRIRRISDGLVYTVAGDGGNSGGNHLSVDTDPEAYEGAVATSSSINPADVAVGDDGTVYYNDLTLGR
ncbi:MAG: hypothetical protein AAF938_15660, partial [Myxococcota bacterium]